MSYEIDKETFRNLFPHANKSKIEEFYEPFRSICKKYFILTPGRVAAFCAQIEIESGSLHYVEEIADGSAYEYRKDLGNLLPEALEAAHKAGETTGRFYKGHGLIQITGFYNHKKCGEALGLDLVNNPKLLTEPFYAMDSAGWYWNTHGCNELADVNMFGAITKKINGGYNGAKERLAAYVRNKKTLEISYMEINELYLRRARG